MISNNYLDNIENHPSQRLNSIPDSANSQQVNIKIAPALNDKQLATVRNKLCKLTKQSNSNISDSLLLKIQTLKLVELNHCYHLKKDKLNDQAQEIERLKAENEALKAAVNEKENHFLKIGANFQAEDDDVEIDRESKKQNLTKKPFESTIVNEEKHSPQTEPHDKIKKLKEINALKNQTIDKLHGIIQQQGHEIATLKRQLQNEIALKKLTLGDCSISLSK